MTVSRKPRKLIHRFLVMAVLAISLVVLPAATSSSQISCCATCMERFNQCDANTIVCCQIYNACVQQCRERCPRCPAQ